MKPLLATALIAVGLTSLPDPASAQLGGLLRDRREQRRDFPRDGPRDRIERRRDRERVDQPRIDRPNRDYVRDRRGDQYEAYRARREGQARPLREIERQVIPRMGGSTYLGPEFDSSSGNYRLKFMRDGQVIWVDVDGRTGQVRGRSGY